MKIILILFPSLFAFSMEYKPRVQATTPDGDSIHLSGIRPGAGIYYTLNQTRHLLPIESGHIFAPTLSPSGEYVAYVDTHANQVCIINLKNASKRTLSDENGRPFYSVYFVNNDFEITTVSYVNPMSNDCYYRQYCLQ